MANRRRSCIAANRWPSSCSAGSPGASPGVEINCATPEPPAASKFSDDRARKVKSNKQRRAEITLRRQKLKQKRAKVASHDARFNRVGADTAPCNLTLLAAHNSYGTPDFVARGYYI